MQIWLCILLMIVVLGGFAALYYFRNNMNVYLFYACLVVLTIALNVLFFNAIITGFLPKPEVAV